MLILGNSPINYALKMNLNLPMYYFELTNGYYNFMVISN